MAENLKKTLNIDGTDYNINAVYSDEAGKVTNPLIVKRSGNAAFSFDGSTAEQTIDYVPTAGGTFSGKVYIDRTNIQDKDLGSVTDNELINYDQIRHLVYDLTKQPLYSWESNQLTDLKNVHSGLSGLNVVVGTTEEFRAFKRLMGVPDITSTDEETRYYGLRVSSSTPFTEGSVDYRTRTNSTYTDVYLPSYGYYNELSTGIIDLSKGVPVTTIREKAFESNKTIEMVMIPESITKIESYAFRYCSALKSIKLPSKLERISTETFNGCTNLESIVIGKNVKKISRDAFKSCSNLRTVYYEGTEDDWLAFNIVDTVTLNDDIKQISSNGNTALTDVYTKSKAGEAGYSFVFNYSYTTEFIDLPCLYICTDLGTNNLNTDNVNKMFLKMPNTGIFVELSRSATYLESPVGATTSGYYTYETLAAIIAGINSRLTALGSTALALPDTLKVSSAEHTIVPELPEEITTTNDKVIVAENVVPSVQELKQAIDTIGSEDGIERGEDGKFRLNEEFYKYLLKQTFKTPSISSFSLTGTNTSGSKEVGTTVTVTGIKHQETNTGNITGNLTLSRSSGAGASSKTVSTSIAKSSSSADVTVSDSFTASSNGTVTYTLSAPYKDTTGAAKTATKTASVSFYWPVYYGATSSATPTDQTGLNKAASFDSSMLSIPTTAANKHVHFLSTGTIKLYNSLKLPITPGATGTVSITVNSQTTTYNYATIQNCGVGTQKIYVNI